MSKPTEQDHYEIMISVVGVTNDGSLTVRFDDVKPVVEKLQEENIRLTARIAEFEKDRTIRDLEMQAKGIEDALNHICGNGKTKPYLKDRLLRRAEKLRNQAKGVDV